MSLPALSQDVGTLEALKDTASVQAPIRAQVVELSLEDVRRPLGPRRALLSWMGRAVLVVGKVALLAAKGGTGKTMALLTLAVAVALGLPWFGVGGFDTHGRGRALLLLAEEDTEEVRRRLPAVFRALGLSLEQISCALDNVTILALAGHGVALTHEMDARGNLPETERAREVRDLLREAVEAGRPYTLLVIDPLSRFAGVDTEKDNAAATRFVQILESFTAPELGGATVVVAHHLRKFGADDDRESADHIRGAVGLHDGVRWAGMLTQHKRIEGAPDLLRLRVVKSNYAPIPEPLELCRPDDGEGTLRVATADEIAAYQVNKGGPRSGVDLEGAVLGVLATEALSGSEIARRLRRGKATVLEVLADLEARGSIVRQGRTWCCAGSVLDRSKSSGTDRLPVGPVPPPLGGTETGTDHGLEDVDL
ncbi:MAG: AAA family ATPase [Myxococcota bacterium]